MIKEQLKLQNSNIFEGMPSISAIIKSIEYGSTNRKIIKIYVDRSKKKQKAKELAFLTAKSLQHGFVIEFCDRELVDDLCVGNTHGGIVAECTDRQIPLLKPENIHDDGVYYLLEGIEDPYNFGNAVRSIYASGADGIIVGERNWLGVSGTIARASAGASELLPSYISDTEAAISLFRAKGYRIVCAGIRNSISIYNAELKSPVLIIVGGEKRGISGTVLQMCDTVVRIDYGRDFKGSLSTSASCAVFAFEVLRQNKK